MSLRKFVSFGFVLAVLASFGAVTVPTADAAGTIVVNDFSDALHSPGCATTGTGTCTLRDAITFANASPGGDTIHFAQGGTITLGASLPAVAQSPGDALTIDGTGKGITVDGAGSYQVLIVNAATTLNLTALTIANGKCDSKSGGGGVTNFGTLNVNGVTFSGNASSNCDGGGGISNEKSGTLNVSNNSTFSGNSAGNRGGGVSNRGTATISGSTFSGNSSGTRGGGMDNRGTATVLNVKFLNNNAGSYTGIGGGISNGGGGALTVRNSDFSANKAQTGGGIFNGSGTLIVKGTTFTGNTTTDFGNGAGIANSGGTTTLNNSTLAANSTQYGGGIYVVGGTVNVTNSTFSGNSARSGGGGIYTDSGALNVTNSTFSTNWTAYGGAIYMNAGTLNVTNSTLSGNRGWSDGGAIYNNGSTATLYNTIVANNSGSGSECENNSGTLTADPYNLDIDSSCGNATTRLFGQIALGPLQDNGGPTQTMALGAGSVALDAGNNAVCSAAPVNALDQRGLARPQGTSCDVGAYESNTQFGPNFVVNDTEDTDDGNCAKYAANFSNCTLREAINAANARGRANTIVFNFENNDPTCPNSTSCLLFIPNGPGLPPITANVTINGGFYDGFIQINGGSVDWILSVNPNSQLNLNEITIGNGKCNCDTGGGIVNHGTLNVTNSTFMLSDTNNVSGDGAGIYNDGTATVTNSTITAFFVFPSTYTGIYNDAGGAMNVVNSTIASNTLGVVTLGTITLRNTIIANNVTHDCEAQGTGVLVARSESLDTDDSCDRATQKTADQLALGTLRYNGGVTQTIKLRAGSVARDAGIEAVCDAPVGPPNYGAGKVDQRGVTRPQGVRCDVGAYEARQ